MKGRKHSPEEALLSLQFTEEELEALTPGEVRLLAALEHETLPEVPQANALEMQRKYRGKVIHRITRVAATKVRKVHIEHLEPVSHTGTICGDPDDTGGEFQDNWQELTPTPSVTEEISSNSRDLGYGDEEKPTRSRRRHKLLKKCLKWAVLL